MRLHEYVKLDALEMAKLVAAKEVTSSGLLACAFEMLEKTQPCINAVANFDRKLGREKAQGAHSGIFQGVPFLVKEILPYPDLTTSMGSRLLAQYIPPTSSEYTRKIDAAGFVTFGNTTSSEFGLLGSTETLLHGSTRNPWNLEYSAAGSSGGSAAAVTAGIVPMAHASDGGGSIRIPTSVCGLFGFKPSQGRTVRSMDVTNPFAALCSEHCITKTVRDSAAFLSLTEQKGADAPLPPIGFQQEPIKQKLRIGVYTNTLMGIEADDEVLNVLHQTAKLCQELGHEVMPTALPAIDGPKLSDAFFTIEGYAMNQTAEMMESMLDRKLNEDDLEPFTLSQVQWFRQQKATSLKNALKEMKIASAQMLQFTEKYDVLLSPTLAHIPQKIGFLSPKLDRDLIIKRTEQYVGYTPIHNPCGMCAMSVPLFRGHSGMPIGSHFAALPGAESRLFGLAYQLEAAAPWIDRLNDVAQGIIENGCDHSHC